MARPLCLAVAALGLVACATVPEPSGDLMEQPTRVLEDLVSEQVESVIEIDDPFEGFNRSVYRFNAKFDELVFLPVVSVYEIVTPDFLEGGISNVFGNVNDVTNALNALFQLKVEAFLTNTGRVLLNTTMGGLGLLDVATFMGFLKHNEDFGQTLGHYGVGNGPYIVLPLLGPSNLRDTVGLAVDKTLIDVINPFSFDNHESREIAFNGLGAVDQRHQQSFRYYETGSPFEYDLVRLLYTKYRELEIAK